MYYGIIFFLLAVMAIYTFYHPDTNFFNRFKIIAFLLLFITSGLRYETAVDWVSYTNFFKNIDPIQNLFNYSITEFFLTYPSELGFTIITSLVKTFTDDVQVLFFLISLTTTTLLFKSILYFTEKKNFFFSVLLYYVLVFFILDMSGIRQCIAVNIIFYAFRSLSENKLLRYLSLVFIAGLFHFSAFIFIIGILLKKEIKLSVVLTIFTVGMIIFLLRIRWMILSIDSLFSLFSNNYIYLRIWNYTVTTSVVAKERPIFIMLFVNSIIYLFYLWGQNKFPVKNVMNTIFLNLYTLYILATLFLWEISDFGVRFGLYFSLGLIICLPYIFRYFKETLNFLIVFFIVFYCFTNARPYILEDRSVISYNPYQNYFIYSLFDLKSTGAYRREIYLNELESK